MVRCLFILGCIISILSSLCSPPLYTNESDSHRLAAPLQLSAAVVGAPITAGDFVIWKAVQGHALALLAYDLHNNTTFQIASALDADAALASDGAFVAWTESYTATHMLIIHGYDLAARTVFTILALPTPEPIPTLAFDQGVLYYTDATLTHRGLFAYNLATQQETMISATGQRPVAADGMLLWSEAQTTQANMLAQWSLHLHTSDGHHTNMVIVTSVAGYAGFSGYAAANGAIVWAFAAGGAPGVYIYQVADGTRTQLAANGSNPIMRAGMVVWNAAASVAFDLAQVYAYDQSTKQERVLVIPRSATTTAWALTADRRVVLSVARDPNTSRLELYLVPAEAQNLAFAVAAATLLPQAGGCNPAWPSSCGQVRISGTRLADDSGVWNMQGVQFFLPQFGINGKTLWDANYASALADGSLIEWLDRARNYLHVNTLRVFVDLPSGDSTPTSYNTLYDLATRANARGMRLGVVPHNSASWTMTSERANWLKGVIDYFTARSSLPMLAYMSADNEINNHCGNSGKDCFDTDASYNARTYVDAAVGWTAAVRSLVKSHAPHMLVTVGVSSEMIDADNTRAAFNFFRADSQGRTLASLSDFLAPHNYSAGAASIMSDLRFNRAYSGPIVLEEFGFPTDPYPRNPYWTEGVSACWLNPLQNSCVNTAPFFVETNLRALKGSAYAGSSAWMLADMREKDTTSACSDSSKSFALWSGLFAIGGTYCVGGTINQAAGQPKATALRICAAYSGNITGCAAAFLMISQRYLPIVSAR